MEIGTRRLLIGFLAAFLVAGVWTGFWMVWQGPRLAQNSYNPRPALAENRIARGSILDRNGDPLVISVWDKNTYKRQFRGPLSAVQTVGYMHARFGKTGLEKYYDAQLRGSSVQGQSPWQLLQPRVNGVDIVTTLDSKLQSAAEKAMAGRKGAAVVLDVSTGAILASVSVPFFDPATMNEALFSGEKGEALFNRALQGRYTPGSAWKPVVLAAALTSRAVAPDELFVDRGSIEVGNHTVHNFEDEVWGAINLKTALVHSSNVAFVQIGMKTSGEAIYDLVRHLGLLETPALSTPATASHLPSLAEYRDKTVRAQAGFGQGSLWVSPLHMAVVAAAIGNGGYAVQPYLVQAVGNQTVAPAPSKQRIMPAWVNDFVRSAMRAVVTSGTGRRAAVSGIAVAGKTGTAENPQGSPHAWFIAYAPAEKPRIALAVVLENANGTGGVKAAPVAAQIIQAALKK